MNDERESAPQPPPHIWMTSAPGSPLSLALSLNTAAAACLSLPAAAASCARAASCLVQLQRPLLTDRHLIAHSSQLSLTALRASPAVVVYSPFSSAMFLSRALLSVLCVAVLARLADAADSSSSASSSSSPSFNFHDYLVGEWDVLKAYAAAQTTTATAAASLRHRQLLHSLLACSLTH